MASNRAYALFIPNKLMSYFVTGAFGSGCMSNGECCTDSFGGCIPFDSNAPFDNLPNSEYWFAETTTTIYTYETITQFHTTRVTGGEVFQTTSSVWQTTTEMHVDIVTISETAPSVTVTSYVTVTPKSNSDSSSSSKLGVGLGVGLGVPLALILIGGLLFFFWWKPRKAAKTSNAAVVPGAAGPDTPMSPSNAGVSSPPMSQYGSQAGYAPTEGTAYTSGEQYGGGQYAMGKPNSPVEGYPHAYQQAYAQPYQELPTDEVHQIHELPSSGQQVHEMPAYDR